MRLIAWIATAVLWLSAGPVAAGDWEDALKAFDADRFEEAFALLVPLAESGDADAQNKLAHMYHYGEGVPVDMAIAHAWSMKSALQRNAQGQQAVGVDLFYGYGVPKDEAAAQAWFERGAEGGYVKSYLSMARRYLKGEGVQADIPRGLSFLRKAVDAGYFRAQLTMAIATLNGQYGLERDPTEAVRLLTLAAQQHSTLAQFTLGLTLLNPEVQDLQGALTWLMIANTPRCVRAEQAIELVQRDVSSVTVAWAAMVSRQFSRDYPVIDRHRHDEDERAAACSGILLSPRADS